MSARIKFLCLTCKAVMDAPVENAGQKINCLKCGQRLQIPPAERAKTILAAGMGIYEDKDTSPPDVPSIPTAQFAPAPPAPLSPTATPANSPTEPAQLGPAVSRSPSQAVAVFLKWLWRTASISDTKFPYRRLSLAGAIGVGVAACLLCTCGGTGVRYIATNGAFPFMRPDITGKWEPAMAVLGMTVEFKGNGTGEVAINGFNAQQQFAFLPGEKSNIDFKWHVEGLKNPVLVIDVSDSTFFKKNGLGNLLQRYHCKYTLEDETLTITPLQPGKPGEGVIVLRRAKESLAAAAQDKSDKAVSVDGFDANDFKRTKAWAIQVAEKHRSLRDNQIALADSVKQFNKDCKRHAGKKFRWSLSVAEVTDHVSLNTRDGLFLKRPAAAENEFWFDQNLSLIVGSEITRQRAAQLKAGSIVTARGTIRKVSIDDQPGLAPLVSIVIENLQGE